MHRKEVRKKNYHYNEDIFFFFFDLILLILGKLSLILIKENHNIVF